MGSAGLIAIIGGGPAGAAAAVTARDAGCEVVLYDAGRPPGARPSESLPPGGEDLVREIFGEFRTGPHRPAYANRSTWGSDEQESSEFMFNPLGHGWHLGRRAFDDDLLGAVRAKGVTVRRERVRNVQADFAIDATGRSARVARARGASRLRVDRLVAAFRTAVGSEEVTVTALGNGWQYTAPGIEAFLTDADLLRPAAGLVTDASTSYLDRISGEGWVATGDAAAAFDPLSSQGIVTALLMGRKAGLVAAGELDPVEYEQEYASLVLEHLALRDAYYAAENRWPDAPFWKRRLVRELATR